jgi:hypothetical protein
VAACAEKEDADRELVWNRVRRLGPKDGRNPKSMLPKVGISRLRGFLERRVDECYRRNVAKIVPLLKAEYIAAERRLKACERDLEAISLEKLKAGADSFCDDFCKALRDSIQGSIIAPASSYGETLEQENLAAGSFAGTCLSSACCLRYYCCLGFSRWLTLHVEHILPVSIRCARLSHVSIRPNLGASTCVRSWQHPT